MGCGFMRFHEIHWDSMRFHEIPVSHQPQSHAWPQLPLYVDRLLLLAKNADGLGNPTTTEGIITDRIGQTGSFQKPLDMAAHGTATAGTISTKIQKCREKIGESVRVVYTYRFWIFETRNGFFTLGGSVEYFGKSCVECLMKIEGEAVCIEEYVAVIKVICCMIARQILLTQNWFLSPDSPRYDKVHCSKWSWNGSSAAKRAFPMPQDSLLAQGFPAFGTVAKTFA